MSGLWIPDPSKYFKSRRQHFTGNPDTQKIFLVYNSLEILKNREVTDVVQDPFEKQPLLHAPNLEQANKFPKLEKLLNFHTENVVSNCANLVIEEQCVLYKESLECIWMKNDNVCTELNCDLFNSESDANESKGDGCNSSGNCPFPFSFFKY